MTIQFIPSLNFEFLSEPQVILIIDQLDSPADFLLHRALISHLKESAVSPTNPKSCTFISTSGDLAHWSAISARSVMLTSGRKNFNLSNFITSKALDFVDANVILPPISDSSLRSLYERITQSVPEVSPYPGSSRNGPETSEPRHVVILDDTSSLEWIGLPYIELSRFIRAVRGLCLKRNATLIVLHHTLTPNDPSPLLRDILQACHIIIETLPLSSGRSSAVSGEIAVHPGTLTDDPQLLSATRNCSVQYRLTDSGAVFFQKGTAGGVL